MIGMLCLMGVMVYVGQAALDSAFDVKGFRSFDPAGRAFWFQALCTISAIFYGLAAALAVSYASALKAGLA